MELNNTAIHCLTKELAQKVIDKLYQQGYTWSYGTKRVTNWEVEKENTCYSVTDGSIGYSHIDGIFIYDKRLNVISAEEFLTKDTMKTYELIKSYPGHENLGETTQEDMSKYPEYWKEVKKEFKLGEWVTYTPSKEDEGINYFWGEVKTFKLGDINDEYGGPNSLCNNYLSSFREATPEEISKAKEVKIGEYKVELSGENMFKIGCQAITRGDLGVVESLLKSPINAKITIHGTEITKELIQKIKNL